VDVTCDPDATGSVYEVDRLDGVDEAESVGNAVDPDEYAFLVICL
jgi:hypothetical protein